MSSKEFLEHFSRRPMKKSAGSGGQGEERKPACLRQEGWASHYGNTSNIPWQLHLQENLEKYLVTIRRSAAEITAVAFSELPENDEQHPMKAGSSWECTSFPHQGMPDLKTLSWPGAVPCPRMDGTSSQASGWSWQATQDRQTCAHGASWSTLRAESLSAEGADGGVDVNLQATRPCFTHPIVACPGEPVCQIRYPIFSCT